MKKIINLVKDTFSAWSADRASRLAAALAYYTVFSLAPLLVIVIAIAGFLGRSQAAQRQIMNQLQTLIGPQGSQFIGNMIESAGAQSGGGTFAVVISTVTLLFGALGVFRVLRQSLNTVWKVRPKPAEGIKAVLLQQVIQQGLAFAMVLVIGFLMLVTLIVNSLLAGLKETIQHLITIPAGSLQVMDFIISLALITILFALIYKFLPSVRIDWKDVWLGAFVTALLFNLGKFAIGLYLGQSSVSSIFGAAGSLAVLLVWVYYSAQILFFGAEFTYLYANRYGSKIEPSEKAVRIIRKEEIEDRQEETEEGD